MRAIPLLALLLAGLCPAAALASGSDDDVMVVAGNRVTTTRGAFSGEDEPDVVVLRGAHVGGAIPDPTRARRERRPQLPPLRSDADSRDAPVRIRILVPSVVVPPVRGYGVWLPYERSRHHRIKGPHAHGKNFGRQEKHRGHGKHSKRYEKHEHRGTKLRVAAAPSHGRSSIPGASDAKRRHGAQRGGKGAKHGPGRGFGRRH